MDCKIKVRIGLRSQVEFEHTQIWRKAKFPWEVRAMRIWQWSIIAGSNSTRLPSWQEAQACNNSTLEETQWAVETWRWQSKIKTRSDLSLSIAMPPPSSNSTNRTSSSSKILTKVRMEVNHLSVNSKKELVIISISFMKQSKEKLRGFQDSEIAVVSSWEALPMPPNKFIPSIWQTAIMEAVARRRENKRKALEATKINKRLFKTLLK